MLKLQWCKSPNNTVEPRPTEVFGAFKEYNYSSSGKLVFIQAGGSGTGDGSYEYFDTIHNRTSHAISYRLSGSVSSCESYQVFPYKSTYHYNRKGLLRKRISKVQENEVQDVAFSVRKKRKEVHRYRYNREGLLKKYTNGDKEYYRKVIYVYPSST